MKICAAFVLLVVLLSVSVMAAEQKYLDASTAHRIIQGCVAHSTAKKQSHAIAIVDTGGALLAYLRMDGNPPGVGDFAMQKARAVASWRFSTEAMATSAASTPGFANAPNVVTVPGGLPVYSDQIFVGAVGVSGESAQDDVACAKAGISAAGFRFQMQ